MPSIFVDLSLNFVASQIHQGGGGGCPPCPPPKYGPDHIVTNFPEICAFIIGFSFTVWTKKSAKNVRKQVRGWLQNLYQSVAIHLKYVLLVLL